MTNEELEDYVKNLNTCVETLELEDLKSSYDVLSVELDLLRSRAEHTALELECVWAIRRIKDLMISKVRAFKE